MKITKTQKIALIGIPALVGAYLVYRQFKGKKVYQESLEETNCCKIKPTPAGCTGCGGGYTPTNNDVNNTQFEKYIVDTLVTNLNVRQSPSSSSAKVGSLAKGTVINARPSSTSGWFEYSSDGAVTTGYVSADYLKKA